MNWLRNDAWTIHISTLLNGPRGLTTTIHTASLLYKCRASANPSRTLSLGAAAGRVAAVVMSKRGSCSFYLPPIRALSSVDPFANLFCFCVQMECLQGGVDPRGTSSACRWVCRWRRRSTAPTIPGLRTFTSSPSRASRGGSTGCRLPASATWSWPP
jgi:hypothetical protein